MNSGVKIGSAKQVPFHNDLKRLLAYVYYDERKDYIGYPSRNHIYVTIRRVIKQMGFKPDEFLNTNTTKLG